MQRKDIDQLEFDDLCSTMRNTKIDTGEAITTVCGTHPTFGALILIAASGNCTVLGNDVHLIVGRDETIEDDTMTEAA